MSVQNKEILSKISAMGVIPVVVIDDAKDALSLAKALIDGGLPCAELTFRTAACEEAIKLISKEYPEMLIGAGTVLTTEQADKAVAAGADFIVSPGFNPEVVSYCIEKGITIIPGVATPSEIEQALTFSLEVLKFFPAEANGGIDAINAISAPYGSIKFMPTGGISEKNIAKYLTSKKIIACGGSWMVKKDLIAAGEFEKITAMTKSAVSLVDSIRNPKTEKEEQVEKSLPAEGCEIDGFVSFGEIMLRLCPYDYLRFIQTDYFEATYGGGEANTAVSMAHYGFDSSFVTKLPKHEIGQAAVNSLRKYGVDTSKIVRGGDRVGIYYLEKGASQRPSKVIYDRAGSSIACASGSDFDWDKIFAGKKWFHFTGITPALGDNVAEITLEALKAAKKNGLTVSCDLNYRGKLWTREKAGKVMAKLCEYVDVLIANEEDAGDVFGIRSEGTDVTSGVVNHDGYKSVARQLKERFGFAAVAITLRESVSANDNNWSAMLCCNDEYYFSKKYAMHIVDRVGGGDSFAGGLICAMMKGFAPKQVIEFAVAASCLKHSVQGDFNMVSFDEVMKLAGGDGSGRVQR